MSTTLTPEQKAKELVNTFYNELPIQTTESIKLTMAKLIAMSCVKEIIDSRSTDPNFDDALLLGTPYYTPNPLYKNYWDWVMVEICKIKNI